MGAGLGLFCLSLSSSASAFVLAPSASCSVLSGSVFLRFSLSLSFSGSLWTHSQLTSERAVEGALSISSPLSLSESSEFAAEVLLRLLEWLSVVLRVLDRFRTDLPVWGGDARLGETRDMLLRKSK